MDEARRHAILQEVASWLEKWSEADPLPAGLDPALPERPRAPDHAELVSVLTALRGELRQQGKTFARLAAEIAATRDEAARTAVRREREAALLAILAHHDRLVRTASEARTACEKLGRWARRRAPGRALRALSDAAALMEATLLDDLASLGVQPLESDDISFDPNRMRAVAAVAAPSVPEGQVVETVRRGFLLEERVLRAADVKVARHRPGAREAPCGSPERER